MSHDKTGNQGWFRDPRSKVAMAVVNPRLPITEIGPTDNQGFRWIVVEGIRVHACYWSLNTNFAAFENFLDRLEVGIRISGIPVLVASDFKSKSPEWGDNH